MAPVGNKGNKRTNKTIPLSSSTVIQSKATSAQPQLKSCLRSRTYIESNNNNNDGNIHRRLKSKVNSFLTNKGEDNNNLKGYLKKRVSFAPGTVMVDRENKPYNRMMPKPRPPPMPDLFSGCSVPLPPGDSSSKSFTKSPSNQPQNRSGPNHPKSSGPSTKVTNEYTKFTLAKKAPEHALHTEMDRLPARVKRLFENIENLQVAHVAYNSLPSTEVREKFLLDQVIRRQIVSLEISMSEGLIHFAMDVIDTMYEATQFIRSLFHEDFYHPDGSHTLLPIILNNDSDDYINKLAPVVYALNRISGNRRRSDNSSMNIETVCTKLQLEMISLTICPAKSLMFRSILEVVPSTAMRARQLLEEISNKSFIKWVNNSPMRKDYTKVLINFKLIDKHDIVTKFPPLKKVKSAKTKERESKSNKSLNYINPAAMGDVSIPS